MKNKLHLLAAGIFLALANAGLGQSTLQFASSSSTVPDWATNTAVPDYASPIRLAVQRTNDIHTIVSVDYATADGTATNGLKYAATNGTLVFAAGETNKAIVVQLLDFNEGLVEDPKTFQVILTNPTNAVLGTPATNTVSILNVDVGVQLQFASYNTANGSPAAEDGGAVLIGVVRGDDANLPVSVDYFTSDLTAISGVDYSGLTNTLPFAPQERLKFVPIPILNDSVKEAANKTFLVTLANPVGVTLGSTKTTTVTIVDNDQCFQFEAASIYVAEDAGVALIGVLRGTDDTNSTVTVDLATANNSASHGLDYTGLSNTLSFTPGERRKIVPIPILNDGVRENPESFRVTLSNPTGGAVLGIPTTTTVNLRDNDAGLGFETGSYKTAWGQGADFAVTVLRGNDGALGPITVDYATSDLTGTNGLDYQGISGTLTFEANETVKSLTIPILRNRSGKSFRVTLSNPTPGVTLGIATTTVTTVGVYATVAPPSDTALTIRREWGVNILTWAGGGQLQRADKATGPWQTLTTATNPCTVQSPVPTTFYRVTRPRPVSLYVPSSCDGQTNVPLVIMLHGYYMSSASYESRLQIEPLAQARGFLYCYPQGTMDRFGYGSWNGTDAAGDFYNSGVDDAGYLRGLIEEISRRFAVDRQRVHLLGIWIGGFMAYRMACQSADLIAGIATLSSATFLDAGRCQPSELVNVLHVHATADEDFFYQGGALGPALPYPIPANTPPYPGAVQSVQTWAAYNGARDALTDPAPSMDLDGIMPGLDTVVTRYTSSLPGGDVELWSIVGASHLSPEWPTVSRQVMDWLLAHPKP